MLQHAAKLVRERFQELVEKNTRRLLNLRGSNNMVQKRLEEVDKAEKDIKVQLRSVVVQMQV